MATVKITYTTKVPNYLLVQGGCCGPVGICLPVVPWAAQTVSGIPFIIATVMNTGRYLGSGGREFSPSFENVRCDDLFQYDLEYDDTQLLINVSTGLPYVVTCDDIGDIVSACIVNYFLTL